MNEQPKYTNIGDHDGLDKMADMVILNCKHEFTEDELKQEADMLAQCVSDKQQEENNKKVAMSVFKNKIDTLQGEINLHASNINHGFTYVDKATTMYRDFDKQRRVYFDKQTGDFLKDEAFHPSDFQKKLDFDAEETARQEQIAENNAVGDYVNATPDENGMYIGADGNLTDIPPRDTTFDPVDDIIVGKKVKGAKVAKLKPTPKDVLPDNYGKDFEQDDSNDDLPNF